MQIQRVDGEPVVRVSEHEGVLAGDTITSIDGVDAADWYAEAMSRYSASSDGCMCLDDGKGYAVVRHHAKPLSGGEPPREQRGDGGRERTVILLVDGAAGVDAADRARRVRAGPRGAAPPCLLSSCEVPWRNSR